MLPHMGKWMVVTRSVIPMIMTPIHRNPSCSVMEAEVKKIAWVIALPELPAARHGG